MIKHSDIPSFKDDSIDKNLQKFIKHYNPSSILEVGVGLGSSTWNILDCINKHTLFHAIDKFEFDPEPYRIEKVKQCKNYYNLAKEQNQIINDKYDHYSIFCWLVEMHRNSCTIINQDIWNFMYTKDNIYEFVYLDNAKHLPVLYKQLEFFKSSKVICGTGYSNEHNKIDVDNFSKNKTLFTDQDFWLIS